MLKLHLGSGVKKIAGWVNIDVDQSVNPDVVDNIFLLESVADNSADECYCSHALEHILRPDVPVALKRWFDILKPGGLLRVAVPDIEAAMRWYNQTFRLEDIRGLLWGGQKNRYDFHCLGWDERTLTSDLTNAGFIDVKRYDFRETEHFYIDDYSSAHLPANQYKTRKGKWEGMSVSLNMECRKPL